MNISIEYNGEPVEFASYIGPDGELVLLLDELDIERLTAQAGAEADCEAHAAIHGGTIHV